MSFTRLLPIILFVGLVAALGIGLTLEPKKIPSALIDKPVPEFELPGMPTRPDDPGLATADLMGHVSLVNVFASWCPPCKQEHPVLMAIKDSGFVPIYGLDLKDNPRDAEAWLKADGDPYTKIGYDKSGRVSINWGVYGQPETFIIDKNGRIRYKHIGPMSYQIYQEKIRPMVEQLRAEPLNAEGATS